jgi:hypothetical protein
VNSQATTRYPAPQRTAFAQFLRDWWPSQTEFKSKRQLAKAAGIGRVGLLHYFSGRHFPTGDRFERLHRITSVPHFTRDGQRFPPWAEELLAKAFEYAQGLPAEGETKRKLRDYFAQILGKLTQAGISGPAGIGPETLTENAPAYRSKHHALSSFARFLVSQRLWDAAQERDFGEVLSGLYKGTKRRSRKERRALPVPVLKELIVGCGLSIEQVRLLRRSQITSEGIRIRSGRLIPFGEGRHRISRASLERWQTETNPQDFLFYQRSPLNYSKPVGYLSLLEAIRADGVKLGRRHPAESDHFEKDFRDHRHFKNLRDLRHHYRYFHGMSLDVSWLLMRRLIRSAQEFVVPEPFLLAVICASRLLPRPTQTRKGGERCSATWPHLLRRYEVTESSSIDRRRRGLAGFSAG